MSLKKKGYSSWVELLALLLFDLCLSCCLNSFSQERERERFFFFIPTKNLLDVTETDRKTPRPVGLLLWNAKSVWNSFYLFGFLSSCL